VTASVIIGIVALILITIFGVLVAYMISKALSKAFLALDRIDERNSESLQKTLDRLMTIDWEKYAALRSMEDTSEEGGFAAPGEAEDGGQLVPNFLGRMRMTTMPDLDAEEQALLDEDFPEEVSR
jgi:hypothetical protein